MQGRVAAAEPRRRELEPEAIERLAGLLAALRPPMATATPAAAT
jgi:hypothetical protein